MKKKILLVDDEQRFLDGMCRALSTEREKWNLTLCLSATEAQAMIEKISFDAIITDINMPGKDGLALLRDLRMSEKTSDIPVIMLTGRTETDIKRHALDLGATDLLNKPVNREDLIARIRNVLKLKHYQDRLKEQNRILDMLVRERTADLENSRLEIIMRLSKAAEFRDKETGNHVVRVGCYSRILAREMNMDSDFTEMIFQAAPLHDIGKIGIPDHILLKPDRLTSSEWDVMNRHCSIGADLLLQDPLAMSRLKDYPKAESKPKTARTDIPILKMASSIAMSHHERWDGTGYPNGTSNGKIPVAARIVALADTYDALCFTRPYRPACGEEKAVDIIERESARQFDPAVCAAFENVKDEFREVRSWFSNRQDRTAHTEDAAHIE